MNYSGNCSFSSFFGSVLFAFFVDIKCINYILNAMLGTNSEEEGGFLVTLYIAASVFLIITSILQKNSVFRINKYVIFLILYILAWYQYTNAVIGVPRIRYITLCMFTLVAFISPSMVQINPKIFIRSVMLLPLMGVFYSSVIFSIQGGQNELHYMPMCYAFLVPVLATIIYLINDYKQDSSFWKIIGMVSVSINFFYGYKILTLGPRGPFLCIISLLLFYFLFKKKEGLGIKIQGNKTILIIISGFFISAFLWEISTYLNSTFHFLGIDLNAINKNIELSRAGDMSNGREFISGIAIKGFIENPIFGYGFDQFENNTGICYPHNFVLQILYDGGLLFFFLLLVPVIYKLYVRMKTCDINEYMLIPFFFFISVPGAMISSDMWLIERLWIFFGVVFASHFIGIQDAKKIRMKV